jgi:sugar (pentulose or hexulose) kinase
VAFDLGAESGRAVLGTLAGQKLSLEVKHRFANTPVRMNGTLYWNTPSLWADLKAGLRKSAGIGEGKAVKLDGIAVDTWGVDFGLFGRNGELLGLPVHYRDGRTDGMVAKACRKIGRENIFNATGIQFMQLNSLYQLLALADEGSELLDMAQSLLFMPDLFTYLFSGKRVCEVSIASTSQMYDPAQKSWAMGLLRKLGIPSHFLGKVTASGRLVGGLRQEVIDECEVDVPVISTAGHDTASAVVAAPGEGENWCYISSGTWSLMGLELDRPVINAEALKANYTNEVGACGKIRFLKNIMGLWLVQECKRQWEREGRNFDYATLTKIAAEAKPFAAVITPDHAEFFNPGRMPQKIAEFCRATKQKSPADEGQTVRVCLEALALAYRRTLENLEKLAGRKIDVVHIVGGGTQNALLNQMAADACGRKVVAGPVEATAAGNILVQAMATGEVKDLRQAREIVRNSFEMKTYEPRETAKWEKAYECFRGL